MTSLPVLLSKGFSPLVKSGDVVTVGQILAQNIYKDDVIINLPNDLAIPLAKVKKVLKKNPGDTLSEGEAANLLYYLDSSAIGKIIVGGLLPRDVLVKGIGMGAIGIIGSEIEEADIAYIAEKKLPTPVIQIDTDAVQRLITWKGKKV